MESKTDHTSPGQTGAAEQFTPAELALIKRIMQPDSADLSQPASVDLTGSASIVDMAQREAHTADDYTLALVKRIGITDLSFNRQISRLQALAGIATGSSPDNVTAEELARHYAIAYALYERFSLLAADCAQSGKTRAAGVYISAATSASRASLSVLNALESLRQQAKEATTRSLSS